MSDLPVPRPPQPGGATPAPVDVGNTPVSVSARVVADGFEKDENPHFARATLVLRPTVSDAGSSAKVNLRRWPSEVMRRYFLPDYGLPHGSETTIRIMPAVGLAGGDDHDNVKNLDRMLTEKGVDRTLPAKLMWKAEPSITHRIDEFWRVAMDPPEHGGRVIWDLMLEALACKPDDSTSVILPRPHQAAALAFTFERGRMLLDALADPESPLASRMQRQELALDRPWYRGDRRTRVASLANDISLPAWGQSPEDEEYWVAPYRKRTAALLAGEKPEPIWPHARAFAAAALADGPAASHLKERVFAAHHVTTPANPSHPVCTTQDMELDMARRRLGALLSLPSLQRLFGFAADLFIDHRLLAAKVKELQQAAATTSPFMIIAPIGAGATWTLARYEAAAAGAVPSFCPASWAEMGSQSPATKFGLRNLGDAGPGVPRYDIITVEPVLAAESGINHASKGEGDASGSALSPADGGVPVLHNGGFRIVQINENGSPAQTNSVCITEDSIQDADDLKTGDRLMIGIRVGKDVADPKSTMWRSPDYRAIRFVDPWEKLDHRKGADAKGWVEKELERRIGPPSQRRRLELDGSLAMPAAQSQLDESPVQDDDKDPVRKRALKIIADSTIALWGSDPGGMPPGGIDRDGKFIEHHSTAVVEELDVTRFFSAPCKDEHEAELLSPSLRFGWPYYAALAQVFEGGGCANTHQTASVVSGNPSLAFPDIGKNGRRFLRHERVNAPMVLVLESDVHMLGGLRPPQRGPDMYVRTLADKKLNPLSSRRLFAPPPVPLQFAMLHDVLRDLGSKVGIPRQGLKGMALLGKKDDPLPSRARVGSASGDEYKGSRYYPDPAASVLVLGLKLPAEKGVVTTAFVEEPVVIPFGACTWPDKGSVPPASIWPDVVPVLVEVKAVEKAPQGPRIGSARMQWLGRGEKLSNRETPGAVQVLAVEIQLGRGEDLLLQAWCVPTINQLADWFDAVEAAGVLAVNESPVRGDPDAACFLGLKAILGKEFPVPDSERAAAAVCIGAGGLRAPSRRSLLTLAGLIHRELLLRPIPALASPLPVRLTHAIDDALLPAPVLGPNLAVTRRLFTRKMPGEKDKAAASAAANPGAAAANTGVAVANTGVAVANASLDDESPADFVNSVQVSDWGLSSTQQGATVTLIGGDVWFDPASTSGLVIEAHCAAPFGEPLDPETGRSPTDRLENNWKDVDPTKMNTFGFIVDKDRCVTFVRKNVIALKFDGLPLPKNGRAGLQRYSLQALMAAAWGEQRQFGDALRAALPAAFQSPGARQLWLRAVPINRHEGFFPPPKDSKGDPIPKLAPPNWCPPPGPPQLWLPATTRPSPPVVDHVSVALTLRKMEPRIGMNGVFTVGVEQVNSLTIWHGRPFLSSGEGEMLALVCWPPGLFARGIAKDEKGKELFPIDSKTRERPEFFDDDLGPGGGYVTRWGADPLVGNDVSKFPTGPLFDPARLPDDGVLVPRAFMPVPVAGSDWATDAAAEPKDTKAGSSVPQAKPAENAPPNTFLAVALHAFAPKFDPVEELWYVNLLIRTDPLPFPRVRLGLVRYQPQAREDDVPPEGDEPVRLRVSTPTTEWVKPLPGRKATATCRRRSDGNTEIVVVVDGPAAVPGKEEQVEQDMYVEIIRHRRDGESTQEETAIELDGRRAACNEWSTDAFGTLAHGLLTEVQGGRSWSCMFVLPGPLDANGWSHAVTVKETRKVPRASDRSIGNTGPNFVARIELSLKL
jgi:hypothetical protein